MTTPGALQRVAGREQPVEPGDAHVHQPLDARAERLGDDRRLLGDRQVARAGRDHQDGARAGGAGRSADARCTVRASGFQTSPGEARPERVGGGARSPGCRGTSHWRPRAARRSPRPGPASCPRRRPPRAAPDGARDGGRCGRTRGLRRGGGGAVEAPRSGARRPAATSASRVSSCSALTPPRRPDRDSRERSLRPRPWTRPGRAAGADRSRHAGPWCTSRGACGTR